MVAPLIIAAGISAGAGLIGSLFSSSKARKDERRAQALQTRQLDIYEREEQRYQDVYGDIEENLGNFYQTLSPDDLVATGLQESATAYADSQTKLREKLSQRGIGGGGIEAQALSDIETQRVQQGAQVRRDAPFQVAKAQEGFLSQGRGARQNAIAGQANILGQQAATAQQSALQSQQGAGASLGAGLSLAGQFIGQDQQQDFLTKMLGNQTVANQGVISNLQNQKKGD